MLVDVSRRVWRVVCALLLAVMMFCATPQVAAAFEYHDGLGDYAWTNTQVGACTVELYLLNDAEYAQVILTSDNFGESRYADGKLFSQDGKYPVSDPITVPFLQNACGLTGVTNLKQSATGEVYGNASYLGFSFTATEGDTTYNYEYAFKGQANTTWVGGRTELPKPPVVTPPADQTVASGATVTLTASSDKDLTAPPQYTWALSGTMYSDFGSPSSVPTLTGTDTKTLSFTAPTLVKGGPSQLLIFRLSVSDGTNTVEKYVTITVTPPTNSAPIASAGADQEVASGETARLSGSARDEDMFDTLTYTWTQVSAVWAQTGLPASDAPVLTGANSLTPSFTAPTLSVGDSNLVLTYQLTVSDGLVGTNSTVRVFVMAPTNSAPTVDAGADQTVGSSTKVTLAATASDPDQGQTLTYSWTADDPDIALNDAKTATPFFYFFNAAGNAPKVVTLTVSVSDGFDTQTDTVKVTINPIVAPPPPPPIPIDSPPEVIVTASTSEAVTGDIVTLTADATDPDGDTLTYEWTQTAGPLVAFNSVTAPSVLVTAPEIEGESATLTFKVTVAGKLLTTTKTVSFVVRAPSPPAIVNNPPVAVAYLQGLVTQGQTVTLTGSSSSDPDGDSLSYKWTQISGPKVSPSGAGSMEATFTAPALTWRDNAVMLKFGLTVTDSKGLSNSTTIQIEVSPPERSELTAAISASQSEVVSGETVILDGSGSIGSGGTLTYLWASDYEGLTISGSTGVSASFVAPKVTAATVITLTLTVTEDADTPTARRATTTKTITVKPNAAPVLAATVPTSVIEGSEARLDASASSDLDSKLTLGWQQKSGITVEMRDCGVSRDAAPDFNLTPVFPKQKMFPIMCFIAPMVPEGQTSLTLVFELTGSDDVTTVTKSYTVTVTREGETTTTETEVQIAKFVEARMASIIALQPDLTFVLGGGEGSGNLTVSSMGGDFDLGTAPDQPFWLRVKGNWSRLQGAEGDYLLGAAGTHIKVSDALALGVMAQVDHLKQVDGATVSEGTGWQLGPYVVAKLPDQPLTVQGRLLYGQTQNSQTVAGATDSFGGDRLLAQLGLSGRIAKGDVIWTPNLQAAYARETTEAFTAAGGGVVAGSEQAVAQISAGTEVSFPLPVSSGDLKMTLGAADVWSGTLTGPASAIDGHRGRVSAGVARAFASGATLSLTGSYDGIGAKDYESFGLDLLFEHKF